MGYVLAKKNVKNHYLDSFILVIDYVRICFHLPYRQTEGIIKVTGKNLPDHPCIHKYVEE